MDAIDTIVLTYLPSWCPPRVHYVSTMSFLWVHYVSSPSASCEPSLESVCVWHRIIVEAFQDVFLRIEIQAGVKVNRNVQMLSKRIDV